LAVFVCANDGYGGFHLGTLLRLQGQPVKAAALHRGLTARQNLPRGKKVSIGLALTDDLIALKKWPEASEVLDTLIRDASNQTNYWKSRFIIFHNLGNLKEAALSLKNGPRRCPEKDKQWFELAYAAYQLDRAMGHALQGETRDCRNRLKDVRNIEGTEVRQSLVEAILAATNKDATEAKRSPRKSTPLKIHTVLPLLLGPIRTANRFAAHP